MFIQKEVKLSTKLRNSQVNFNRTSVSTKSFCPKMVTRSTQSTLQDELFDDILVVNAI
jgi:hypothetical protein